MKLPSLPTDNLYKFMAIFGLAIFVYGTYIYSTRIERIEQVTKELFIQEKLDSISNRYEKALATVKNDSVFLIQNEGLKYFNNVDSLIDEGLKKSKKKFSSNTFEVKYELSLLRDKYNTIFNITGYLGAALMIYGFRLWYSKHQKYIDAEMKYKGENFIQRLKEKERLEEKDASKENE